MAAADIPTGNLANIVMLQATLTPAEVAAATTAQQTFTVQGLRTSDMVFVQKPTAQAGIGISGAVVIAANVLGISFVNATAATATTPTAGETYLILVVRRENLGPLPTAFI
jgi:hypothetical protein